MPTALITGVAGQDGAYLSELLLEKGYKVHGVVKNTDPAQLWRLRPVLDRIKTHVVDLTDAAAIERLIEAIRPNEIYNLASPSFVPDSWRKPQETAELCGLGVLKLLDAILSTDKAIKFFQASSSEMFGQPLASPQNEATPLNPSNPYAVAKTYGHLMTGIYRRHHGLFAVSGIMFNHESPLRSEQFVTRKITRAAAKIKRGELSKIRLGNLDAQRDWGYAKDYAVAMWLMLQQPRPDDYVIATGLAHSVRDLARLAFHNVGLDHEKYVEVDETLWRPAEKYPLVGDSSKARKVLGWAPSASFEQVIQLMVEADLKAERSPVGL